MPRTGPAEPEIPCGTEEIMNGSGLEGYVVLHFHPEALRVDSADLSDQITRHRQHAEDPEDLREVLTDLLKISGVKRFRAATKPAKNNDVVLEADGTLWARLDLKFVSEKEKIEGEILFDSEYTRLAEIFCWVSLRPGISNGLCPGMWTLPYPEEVGILVTTVPISDDPHRMRIHVRAKNFRRAREALLMVLRGETRPTHPFVI